MAALRLRLRDIVVRDADGTVVATAPKAEVGISGMGLLTGNVRAESLNLVGAEMSVRIETDGRVTVFAGANKRPIATASAKLPAAQPGRPAGTAPPEPLRDGSRDIAGVLAWIDGLGATGLDGHDLRELGLKNGNLIVDDQRNGKHWTFSRINVSLTRPEQGGVIFRLASDDPPGPGCSAPRCGRSAMACARSASRRAMYRPKTFCWPCASTKAISTSTCRCRRACARKSRRMARCSGCRARCSRMRAPSPITPATMSL